MLWDNIGFSIADQNYRTVVSIIVQIITAILSVYLSLLITRMTSQLAASPVCPDSEVDITTEMAYQEQTISTLIGIVKA